MKQTFSDSHCLYYRNRDVPAVKVKFCYFSKVASTKRSTYILHLGSRGRLKTAGKKAQSLIPAWSRPNLIPLMYQLLTSMHSMTSVLVVQVKSAKHFYPKVENCTKLKICKMV